MKAHDPVVRLRAHQMLTKGRASPDVAAALGVNISTVRNWKRAGCCVDCGAPKADTDVARCRACAAIACTRWTRELLIQRVHEYVAKYGRTPRAIDWNPAMAVAQGHPETAELFYEDGCWPHQFTVHQKLGSLNAAVEAAGYAPRLRGHRIGMRVWPRDKITEAIQEWVRTHGETPTTRDWWWSSPNHPATKTVVQAFGKWNAAIAAAGFATRAPSEHRRRRAAA